ncbi:MAG: hypothetical protein IJE68_04395 [Clostridia bacterium]|nr:hypothetical protein [Clostridia bacterium]
MKKILYFLPVVLGCILYIFLGIASSFGSINPFVWIALGLLLISGLLMNRNKWWGCFLGILIGVLLIYMGSRETGQIIKETPFGIIMCIYYSVCAVITFRENLTKK